MNNFFMNVGVNLAAKFPKLIGNSNGYICRISPTISSLDVGEEKLKQIWKISPKNAAGPDDITSKELSILQDDVIEGIKVVSIKVLLAVNIQVYESLLRSSQLSKYVKKIESPN